MSSGLPDNVERFLGRYIASIELREVLLLLHGSAQRSWTAEEVSAQLRIQTESAERRLAHLASERLVAADATRPRAYRFGAEDAALAQTLLHVERAYRERRVAVVTFVFSRPVADVFVFADAFKLKRGK